MNSEIHRRWGLAAAANRGSPKRLAPLAAMGAGEARYLGFGHFGGAGEARYVTSRSDGERRLGVPRRSPRGEGG